MKFKVRTPDGELQFQSFGEVERAWLMGLVGPDDELLEDGKTNWRKASSFPHLVNARRTGDQAWGGSWFLWTVIGILGSSCALWLIHDGLYLPGGALAFAMVSVIFTVVAKAQKRSRPHGVVAPTSSRPPPSPDRQQRPS